jgi:hypothetical protein
MFVFQMRIIAENQYLQKFQFSLSTTSFLQANLLSGNLVPWFQRFLHLRLKVTYKLTRKVTDKTPQQHAVDQQRKVTYKKLTDTHNLLRLQHFL